MFMPTGRDKLHRVLQMYENRKTLTNGEDLIDDMSDEEELA